MAEIPWHVLDRPCINYVSEYKNRQGILASATQIRTLPPHQALWSEMLNSVDSSMGGLVFFSNSLHPFVPRRSSCSPPSLSRLRNRCHVSQATCSYCPHVLCDFCLVRNLSCAEAAAVQARAFLSAHSPSPSRAVRVVRAVLYDDVARVAR